MRIDTNTIVSVTEANQNFSRVTRIAEKSGQAVIFKNNRPKYMLIDLEVSPNKAVFPQLIRLEVQSFGAKRPPNSMVSKLTSIMGISFHRLCI